MDEVYEYVNVSGEGDDGFEPGTEVWTLATEMSDSHPQGTDNIALLHGQLERLQPGELIVIRRLKEDG
jgi:hypothetical protein